MISTGLGSPPVVPHHTRIDLELPSQPRHRHRRRGADVIRHESQPRQRAQRHRQAQPIRRAATTARVDERDIRRRQREEPEQLLPADLREPPQPRQLLLREHLRRHRDLPERGPDPQLRRLPSHIRPIFGEYYATPMKDEWTWNLPRRAPVDSAESPRYRVGPLPAPTGLRLSSGLQL